MDSTRHATAAGNLVRQLAEVWANRFAEATRPAAGEPFGCPAPAPPPPPSGPWPLPAAAWEALHRARQRFRADPPHGRPALGDPANYCGLFEATDLVVLAVAGLWPLSAAAVAWLSEAADGAYQSPGADRGGLGR
jgi:hypothetical protein